MITKDEERFIARCLNSVHPVVDEIIVVDTGSADRTREIAELFDAKIYSFQWTGDFSAARNYCISKAAGHWIFSLDADEVISEDDHSLFRHLVRDVTPGPIAYSFVTRNYTIDFNQVGWFANDGTYRCEEAGCGWIATEKIRLFPNHRRILYDYAVHEMVEPSIHRENIEIRSCSIPIHHYGPLLTDKKNLKLKSYYRIGREKLDSLGDNIVALYELANQAAILGKTAEAVELWGRFLALKTDVPEAYVHLSTVYFQLQDYRSAVKTAKKALELDPEMKEAIYNYCLCEFVIGDIGITIGYLTRLLDKSPEFLPARLILAAAHICSGNKQMGRKKLEDLRQTDIRSSFTATLKDLAKRLVDQNRSDYAHSLFESVLEVDKCNTI
jgi:glycosyltransferase involved in cell wall biosynthesis